LRRDGHEGRLYIFGRQFLSRAVDFVCDDAGDTADQDVAPDPPGFAGRYARVRILESPLMKSDRVVFATLEFHLRRRRDVLGPVNDGLRAGWIAVETNTLVSTVV